MHEHKQEPCWDAHCAPHLTHHDAGVRELIARAEARGAERERERIAQELLARNVKWHGKNGRDDCLCQVCAAFRDAANVARNPERAW